MAAAVLAPVVVAAPVLIAILRVLAPPVSAPVPVALEILVIVSARVATVMAVLMVSVANENLVLTIVMAKVAGESRAFLSGIARMSIAGRTLPFTGPTAPYVSLMSPVCAYHTRFDSLFQDVNGNFRALCFYTVHLNSQHSSDC